MQPAGIGETLPAPQQFSSPWITNQAVALATRLPFRQAAYLMGSSVDEVIDHRSLYHWMQEGGGQLVAQEDELQTALFVQGEIPRRHDREWEIVLAEVDRTFLRAQPEVGPAFEVRLGVLTSGKALVSRTAEHRRYSLLERVRCGGVQTAQSFGKRLLLPGEKPSTRPQPGQASAAGRRWRR